MWSLLGGLTVFECDSSLSRLVENNYRGVKFVQYNVTLINSDKLYTFNKRLETLSLLNFIEEKFKNI